MSDSKYIFRSVCYDDFEQHIKLLSQLTVVNEELITLNNYKKFVDSLNKYHIITVIVDTKTNNLIGSGTLLIEPKIVHGMKNVGHIEDIVIDKSYRCSGLGKILINKLETYAKDNNCYKVILSCSDKYKSFYEKSGFTCKNSEMSKYFDK